MSVEALFWAIEQLDELEKPQQRLLLLMLANTPSQTCLLYTSPSPRDS